MRKPTDITGFYRRRGGGLLLRHATARAFGRRDRGDPRGGCGARGDLVLGRRLRSCHAAERAKGDERLKLGGGRVLRTDFGDFVVPNLSSHPETASADGPRGISPTRCCGAFRRTGGTTTRPSLTLRISGCSRRTWPTSGRSSPPCRRSRARRRRQPGFPYSFRRGIGLWKLAFLTDAPAVASTRRTRRCRAGSTWWRGRGIAASATRRATSREPWIFRAGWLARRRRRAKGGSQHHRRRGRDRRLVGGGYRLFPQDRASCRTSIRSAGRWSRCRRTSPCWQAEDRGAMAAYLKAVPPRP